MPLRRQGGPNRILDVSCLVERMVRTICRQPAQAAPDVLWLQVPNQVNYVDDLTFDINDTVLDLSGSCI